MPYAQLDDRFHTHPKIRPLSLAARGLFATGISYAACFLTDGYLPAEFGTEHGRGKAGRRAVQELIRAGLWEPDDRGGYWIHDYLDHNRSRAEVQAIRERARARQVAHRARQRLGWEGGT